MTTKDVGDRQNAEQQVEIGNLERERDSLKSEFEKTVTSLTSKLENTESQLQDKKEQLEKMKVANRQRRIATKVQKDALPSGLKDSFVENERMNYGVLPNLEWIRGRLGAEGINIHREKARRYAKELMQEFPATEKPEQSFSA